MRHVVCNTGEGKSTKKNVLAKEFNVVKLLVIRMNNYLITMMPITTVNLRRKVLLRKVEVAGDRCQMCFFCYLYFRLESSWVFHF